MKLVARIVSTLTLTAAVVACGGGENRQASTTAGGAQPQGGGNNKPLTIKGSDTMVILGQRLAEEYMRTNPGSVI
ncbi:MAG TPA: hypothetical protein VE010_16295, partial [Thermoanaerobaculia bacterium]|nr:hypothetical protein [Thermoanaerobaculia bacterium]